MFREEGKRRGEKEKDSKGRGRWPRQEHFALITCMQVVTSNINHEDTSQSDRDRCKLCNLLFVPELLN